MRSNKLPSADPLLSLLRAFVSKSQKPAGEAIYDKLCDFLNQSFRGKEIPADSDGQIETYEKALTHALASLTIEELQALAKEDSDADYSLRSEMGKKYLAVYDQDFEHANVDGVNYIEALFSAIKLILFYRSLHYLLVNYSTYFSSRYDMGISPSINGGYSPEKSPSVTDKREQLGKLGNSELLAAGVKGVDSFPLPDLKNVIQKYKADYDGISKDKITAPLFLTPIKFFIACCLVIPGLLLVIHSWWTKKTLCAWKSHGALFCERTERLFEQNAAFLPPRDPK